MTKWKVVEKAKRNLFHNVNNPLRFRYTSDSYRIYIARDWLKQHGPPDAKRVTVLADTHSKTIGLSFNKNDLFNGYSLTNQKEQNNSAIYFSSKTAVDTAKSFGYPDRTRLALERDPEDETVWIIKKEG